MRSNTPKPDTHTQQQTLLYSHTDAISLFIHKCRSHVDTHTHTHTHKHSHTHYHVKKQNTPAAALWLQGGFLLVAVTMADVIRPSSSAPHSRGPQGRRNHGNGRPEVSRYNWATAALPVCLQSGGSQRDRVCVCVHLWGLSMRACMCVHVRACVCVCVRQGGSERERERERKHSTPANAGHCQLMEKSSELQHHANATLPLSEEHSPLLKVHSLVFLHLPDKGGISNSWICSFFSLLSLSLLTPPLSSVPF